MSLQTFHARPTMNLFPLFLLAAPLISANAGDDSIKAFLSGIAEEQCLSPSGLLVQDEIDATDHGFLDNPVSTRYPLLTSQLALVLRNALGAAYNFPPDTPHSPTPKAYTSEEAVRMLKSCLAQDALYHLYNTQRFVSNYSIEDCVENAYYIYYEDKLSTSVAQVEGLDDVGVLDNMLASDCAISIMNAFAKHFVLTKHPLEKSRKNYASKVKVDLNEFKQGTEWIEMHKLVEEGAAVKCTEGTEGRRPVCKIYK